MRILLASEPGGGGVGRHVIDLSGGLVARGHEVHIAYSPARAEPGYLDALAATGCPLHALPMQRHTGLHDLGAAFAMRRLLRAAGPFDVVHGHSSKAGALLRMAAMGYPATCLYTPHALITLGPDLSRPARLAYSSIERLLAPLTDGIICVSDEERDHAMALGLGTSRLHVVNNGIGPLPAADRDSVREAIGLAGEDICAGFVGRLAPQKAPERMIEALASALPHCPQLCLAMVGDGEDRRKLESLARERGVQGRVRFIRDAAAARLMAGFDLFAMSSRYEAFPYVFLEAAARGLPILTMDVGGAAAVVRPGDNGYIVPQSQPQWLASHLVELGRDAGRRQRMGRVSSRVAGEFTLDNMVARTLDVYCRASGRPLPAEASA